VYLVGLHIHYKMVHGPYNIEATNILAYSSFERKGRTVPLHAMTVHVRSGSVAPLITNHVTD
jgi:hypothetical protein